MSIPVYRRLKRDRRAYKARWYQDNKLRIEGPRVVKPNQKYKLLAQTIEWREEHPWHWYAYQRRHQLWALYTLSVDEWVELFAFQGYGCACCSTRETNTVNGWHTDHDHETGEVRGILCHRCNVLIGMADDSIECLEAAINYLRRVEELG